MIVLKIEHPVADFDSWKKAFDSDPARRKESGVKRYRIFRDVDNPNFVIVELEFDSLQEAEAMHGALKKLWNSVEGLIMSGPQSKLLNLVETFDY